MQLFDSLIFNDDRNSGNYLVDADWELWLIDYSRAFQIRTAVDTLLVSRQVNALVERRTELVEHIQKMIDECGKNVVIR
jgi:hypothetical protein